MKSPAKKENPDWDGKSFDYGCSCYASALKAYETLMSDNHSGYSWAVTRNILMKLMKSQPLTPITDDDFPTIQKYYYGNRIQCPRMSSLFKYLNPDGTLEKYHDLDRSVCINTENHSDSFSSSISNIIDEMFPITMPYSPQNKPFEIYVKTFLSDRKNGDSDTMCIEYIITPDGKRIDINRYYGETFGVNGMYEISEEEYKERLSRRLDPLYKKAANHLMWTVYDNSGNEAEIERRGAIYKSLDRKTVDDLMNRLEELCRVFEEHIDLNLYNFDNMQAIARGDSDIPELQHLQKFVQDELVNGVFKNE